MTTCLENNRRDDRLISIRHFNGSTTRVLQRLTPPLHVPMVFRTKTHIFRFYDHVRDHVSTKLSLTNRIRGLLYAIRFFRRIKTENGPDTFEKSTFLTKSDKNPKKRSDTRSHSPFLRRKRNRFTNIVVFAFLYSFIKDVFLFFHINAFPVCLQRTRLELTNSKTYATK